MHVGPYSGHIEESTSEYMKGFDIEFRQALRQDGMMYNIWLRVNNTALSTSKFVQVRFHVEFSYQRKN